MRKVSRVQLAGLNAVPSQCSAASSRTQRHATRCPKGLRLPAELTACGAYASITMHGRPVANPATDVQQEAARHNPARSMNEHATLSSQFELAQATQRLRAETELLAALEARGGLSRRAPAASLDVEAWLIDRTGRPTNQNGALITALGCESVRPGRARYQIVLRVEPHAIAGDGIARLMQELQSLWARCQEAAQAMGLRMVAIGILPTVDDADLAALNMSYVADHRPAAELVRIDIDGRDRLSSQHLGVVPCAAATSLRARLQVAPEATARFYNASMIATCAIAGLAANAPFLLGADLWEDTRIALLDKLDATESDCNTPLHTQFAESAEAYFRASLAIAPRTLAANEAPHRFAQLRLHDQHLRRWNHLQIGFDDDGTPHLYVEQRAMSPGPTPADIVANLCFHFGLTASLATEADPPEQRIDAATAHANLLAVARSGLSAEVAWLDRERMPLRSLLIVELIERAHEGLHQLGVDEEVAQRHLSVIERRVGGGQTAAVWQRRFVQAHGRNFALLAREYAARQLGGAPVHEWNLRRLT